MKCKICGGNSIKQVENNYICEICGVEYSKDEFLNENEFEENMETSEKETAESKKKAKKPPVKMLLAMGLLLVALVIATVISITSLMPLMKYNKAMKLISSSKFDEAYSILTELGDYKDSMDQITESKYNRAVEHIEEKDYKNAYDLLDSLGDYKDSVQLKTEAQLNIAQIGDNIRFGAYEQDNNIENGNEEIEWIVIDKKDDKLLLLSKYCLYAGYFDKDPIMVDGHEWVTWGESSRRAWLNQEFLKEAFSEDEQARILKSDIKKSPDYEYYNDMIKNVKDKIFFLSVDEIEKYLSKDQRKAESTLYAKKKGTADKGYCHWWTRNQGGIEVCVTAVDDEGNFDDFMGFEELFVGVRPAMWITLSKEVEPVDEMSEYLGQWNGMDSFTIKYVNGLKLTVHRITNTEIVFDYTSPSLYGETLKNITGKLDSNSSFKVNLDELFITLQITLSYDKITVTESDVGVGGAMRYDFYRSN